MRGDKSRRWVVGWLGSVSLVPRMSNRDGERKVTNQEDGGRLGRRAVGMVKGRGRRTADDERDSINTVKVTVEFDWLRTRKPKTNNSDWMER
ncbi:hypothetical protein TB1_026806 [Malus domestica]